MAYEINPNAKIGWARNNEDTMDISLATNANTVFLNNGRTIEQELGEGKMVSDIATINSPMANVIGETLDGVYGECIFEGRTLVNIASQVIDKPFNTTTDDITFTLTTFVEKWQSVVYDKTLLKPNTTYTVFLKILQNSGSNSSPLKIQLGHGSEGFLNVKNGYTGQLVKTVTTPSELPDTFSIGLRSSTISGEVVKVSEFIVFEGDYSNNVFPHFTGMCDVKNPILQNVGKNLFDGKIELGGMDSIGMNIADDTKKRSKNHIKVNPNTTYCVGKNGLVQNTNILFYDENKKYLTRVVSPNFTTPINCHYVRLYWNADTIKEEDVLQIEESLSPTTYETYRANILQIPEDITLRSVGDIKDTYNVLSGEYARCIGEVVIDGSSDEIWGMNDVWSSGNICSFFNTTLIQPKGLGIVSDKLIGRTRNELVQGEVAISEGIRNDVANIQIFIDKSKLPTHNVEGLKLWLSQNPITIQYPLTNPIATTIEPDTTPFAYKSGHIILKSGYSGQSLLPTLKYATTINRTGQIANIGRTLLKQEAELTELEKMLVSNIVVMNYNNLLLKLSLDMNEVR